MDLKFFFNRKGVFVRSIIVVGWLGTLVQMWQIYSEGRLVSMTTRVIYDLYVLLCFLLTLPRLVPWYQKADRGHGIEEHFERTLVPLGYMMAVTVVVFFFWSTPWAYLLFVIPIISAILMVHGILIYFHLKDGTTTRPSFLVRSLE